MPGLSAAVLPVLRAANQGIGHSALHGLRRNEAMSDPGWYRRLPKWGQDLADQLGHVLIGGGPAALVGGLCLLALPAWASGLVGAIAGAFAMGCYELAQNLGDDDNDLEDMAVDLAVGISSAMVVGTLVAALG